MPENFPRTEVLSILAMLVTVALLYRRNLLRADALANAPDRGGVVTLDRLFLAILLWVAGMGLSGEVPKIMAGASPALTSMVAYMVIFGGPLAFFLWLGRSSPDAGLRLGLRGRNNALSARVGLWGIPTGLVLLTGINVIGLLLWQWWGQKIPTAGHQVFEKMKTQGDADIALEALTAIVLAPLCEEAFFRGLIQTGLHSVLGPSATVRIRWRVVLIVGVLFGVVHIGAVPLPLLGGLVVFGWVLGFVYERTGCFWVPLAIHSAFNAISFCDGLWQIRHPS